MGGKVWGSVLVVAAVGFGAAACGSPYASCGKAPTKPDTIRTPSFFGRVTSDPQKWTIGRAGAPANARLVVGKRVVPIDSTTERLPGDCRAGSRSCSAFVGLAPSGRTAWILLTDLPPPKNTYRQRGELVVSGTVWKVRDSTLVLSEGYALSFGKTLAQQLTSSEHDRYSLRYNLEHDDVGASLYLDPATGEVLEASFAGCA